MGLYQYTMRKDTIVVGGVQIGRFGYAYKIGRDWMPGGVTSQYNPKTGRSKINRAVILFQKAADRARASFPDVEYVVVANAFSNASNSSEGLPVYRVDKNDTQFTEELGKPVGYLTRVGRSYQYSAL